jgi:Cys-tRNA(Pro)/Cys-tRNA(Cys) deacylase
LTANNVTRFLDSKKVTYTTFDLPPEKLGAIESARLLGVPAGQVL